MKFHMDDSGSWSLGVLIGIPALALGIGALVALGLLARWWSANRADSIDEGLLKWVGRILLGCAVVTLILGVAGYYPFGGEYHQFRDVSGTVAKIDSRLIAKSGSGSDTKFVVRFDGSPMQFACDDTRCAQVAEGDALTLSCKRAWQYTGTDGYDCRFVSTDASADASLVGSAS